MSSKVRPQKMTINLDGIKIKVESKCKAGVYVRLYYVYKGEEGDVFPNSPSIFLSEKDPLSIMSSKGFKLKQIITIT